MTKEVNTENELSYISKISRDWVKGEIEKHNDHLERVRKTLAERGEGIADAMKYQKDGADWRRKQVIAECEQWMDATNCPHYLRADNLAKARESVDNAYISKVASALFGLKLDLATEVVVTPSGKWEVAPAVANAMLEAERRVLDADEVEAYRLYQQMIAIADQLHKRYYYFGDAFGAQEDNLTHLDSLEADLEHFLMCRVMTPEERKERLEKLGY